MSVMEREIDAYIFEESSGQRTVSTSVCFMVCSSEILLLYLLEFAIL